MLRSSLKHSLGVWRGVHCGAVRLKEVKENPFFSKYKDKLEKVQGMSSGSERMAARQQKKIITVAESAPPSSYTHAPLLSSIMKVDMLADKNSEEINKIWVEYHKTKDCISGSMQPLTYLQLHAKAKHCPLFVYPLPREEGYELFLSQFQSPRFYFTSLLNYQHYQENAPPCLTLTYFTDLQDSKDVVLMLGEVDMNRLSTLEAQFLTNQMLLYYCIEQSERYNLVRQFNHQPDEFDLNILLEQLNNTTSGQQH